MKKRIIAPILLLLAIAGFSQDINYDVRGKYKHPATKDKLNDARSMNYSATVIPDTQAEFPDGYQQLKQYLKEIPNRRTKYIG